MLRKLLLGIALGLVWICAPLNLGRADYILRDKISVDQNITLQWTVNDIPYSGRPWIGQALVDRSDVLPGLEDRIPFASTGTFDWSVFVDDTLELKNRATSFTFTAPPSATDWEQTITDDRDGSSTVFAGDIINFAVSLMSVD
jgi:hypothetical protein